MSSDAQDRRRCIDIDLALPDRRDGKVRVSYALGRRPAAVRHHRPALGVRPHPRRRAVQGAGAQPAGGVVVRPHGRRRRQPRPVDPRPQRADRQRGDHAAGRGRRPRLHHRRHVDVAVEAATPPAPARSTATTSPTACGRTPSCPPPLVTPTTKPPAGSAVHDEPLTWAEVVERGLVDAARWERVHDDRPRAVRARPGGRRGGRADPRRHQVRVRAGRRRRAAADRRGAHARLVALLGRRDVRGAPGCRRRAREPRQGGRAAGLHRRRLQRRRRATGRARRRLDRHVDPLHRRLRTTHRASVRARQHPVDARIAACVAALREEPA